MDGFTIDFGRISAELRLSSSAVLRASRKEGVVPYAARQEREGGAASQSGQQLRVRSDGDDLIILPCNDLNGNLDSTQTVWSERGTQSRSNGKYSSHPSVTIRTSGLFHRVSKGGARSFEFGPPSKKVRELGRIGTSFGLDRAAKPLKQRRLGPSPGNLEHRVTTEGKASGSDPAAINRAPQCGVSEQEVDHGAEIACAFPPDKKPLSGVFLERIVSRMIDRGNDVAV